VRASRRAFGGSPSDDLIGANRACEGRTASSLDETF
jgi:hypothetical protein